MTSSAVTLPRTPSGAWTRAERRRLAGMIGVILLLHVLGIALYLLHTGDPAVAGGLAGAGTLAYVLGMRHAFDADHIAAIDDTTRLMLLRGRRPVGVGFFFAMGHSTVVLVLALLVAVAAGSVAEDQLDGAKEVGGVVALVVAVLFLLLVAVLNGAVLRSLLRLWRQVRDGRLTDDEVDRVLVDRGLLNRLLGGRLRRLIRSSWHMYPVGLLMGLGLETASEVTLLGMTATSAGGGRLPLLAVLSLPLLFAAGMSAFDTADSLLMTRAYSWAYRNPVRTLFYNTATTAITVVIAVFVSSVYLAGVLAEHAGVTWLGGFGRLAEHFELFGYCIAGVFAVTWGGAMLWWRFAGYDRRYPSPAVQEGVA
ncbi:HoxN/HupN/NixA family nickel/cobalt transporter [Streptoalloteichus hindustanus]|uniref:Nickel/cobalt efflux system n=1 Tax=Streptoalloteichus hindustanus TaxID=2017 RepID=A0A1M5B1R6_STRHI|nr:HoxN/HupN/NixA family nickel/cobalt transporter [Streptoalloteichus hindustanus]SHF36370.1 high-affinity nickel-transport protein [Streptoalloteichus hindustanus]